MKNNIFTFSQFALSEEFNKEGEFELLHTGPNTDQTYGDFQFSRETLEEMAQNFNDGIRGVEIPVDLNHDPQKKAYAWIQPGSMRVGPSSKPDGQYSLYAKLYKYTPEGEKWLKEGSYRYFSLEVRNRLTTMVNKVKKTFNNVITGLALTNTPVIKGLKATYSESLLPNTHNMKEFKALVEQLLQKGHATLSEKEQTADLFVALSEEQKAQVQSKLSEIDSLPEEPKEANTEQPQSDVVEPSAPETQTPSAPAEPAAPEAKTELSENKDEPADKQLAETMRLAEENKTLKEQIAKYAETIRSEKVSRQVKQMMLSEERPVGIAPGKGNANETRLQKFLLSLSEEQAAECIALFSEVRSVDFKEHGKNVGEMSLSEKEALLEDATAEVLTKNPSMPKYEAMTVAARKLGLDKE